MIMQKITQFIEKYKNSDERSREAIKNVALSGVMRGANILAGLLVVPMTINYLNSERYGIWLTLSSIIGWVAFLDLGLSNGFRNRFAEAKANDDITLAKQYLSTTYFIISLIVAIALTVILVVNHFLDWSNILNVSCEFKKELSFVFIAIITFTCLNMVANIFTTLLAADQKPGLASVIQAIGQYVSLVVIYILSKTADGSLSSLALFFSGVPCITTFVASLIMFNVGRYKKYRPEIKLIKPSLTKNIINLGVQFFVIHLCMIAVFQIVNIVISRELGPENVTVFNVSNKYFNIVYMTAVIIINPFWSAFTDAYTKKDYSWMKSVFGKMHKGLGFAVILYMILLAASNPLYRVWVGESVAIPITVSAAMMLLVLAKTFGAINMYLINGIGTVMLQTIIYSLFAIISWPLLTFAANYGIEAVIMVLAVIYLILGLFGHFQLKKIINKTASGIWIK